MRRRAISFGLCLCLATLLLPVSALAQSRAPRDLAGLADAGSAALNEQRFADALDAFTAASKLAPRDASLCLGAGVAAFMLGQAGDARTWLERALKLNPRYTDASILLGMVAYREGKVSEAVDVYESALKYAPDNDQLKESLDEWKKEAQLTSRFYQAQGAHFLVLFEGPADDALARRVVDMLETAYWQVGAALSTYVDRPINVVLYTREQFRDITRSPAWAAGVYDGQIKIPIAGALEHPEELQRILTHEFVHAAVAALAGQGIPAWINEGLAMTLEPGGLETAERYLTKNPTLLPYAQLQVGFSRLSAKDAATAYAQSAVSVKKMMDLRGASAVVNLLQALGRGTTFESAFQQTILMRFEDFANLMR